MSILTIAFPAQVAVPVAQTVLGTAATLARPALGLSALAAMLLVFKPLVAGILRAALMTVTSRESDEQKAQRRALRDAKRLNRLARQAERLQPNLAAELRYLASRG